MKIFIDTNIFLDLILRRKYYKEALMIFNAVEQKLFEGFILDITILNIDYIAKKQTKNIKEFLVLINGVFSVVGATNKLINSALSIENIDLEDNLQYIAAKDSGCKIIITNDKNFYNSDISLMSSEQFTIKYCKTEKTTE